MNVITAVSPRASPILSPVDESQLRSILEFDDDDQHAFSRDIFTKYFAQVNETVAVMNALLYVFFWGRTAWVGSNVCAKLSVALRPN